MEIIDTTGWDLRISHIPNFTTEIIDTAGWNWHGISHNPNITMDFIKIQN
jgi:hypothetical protein